MVKRRRKPKQPRTPSYLLHRATGQAYVELNGQRIYLGRYDKAATKHKYHQIIAEWLANGRKLPVPKDQITVADIIAAFWTHAQAYYRRPDGNRRNDSNRDYHNSSYGGSGWQRA